MDTVYPAGASALARGRRLRSAGPRLRHRTTPVTFAEIKEVDEENSEAEACEARCGAGGARRRPDVLEERLGRQFAAFRRRRERRDVLREREPESPPPPACAPAPAPACAPAPGAARAPAPCAARAPAPPLARAGSEPSALHQRSPADT